MENIYIALIILFTLNFACLGWNALQQMDIHRIDSEGPAIMKTAWEHDSAIMEHHEQEMHPEQYKQKKENAKKMMKK